LEPITTCHNNQRRIKKNAARKEFKNLITQGWERTEEDLTKKRARGANT